MIPNVAWFVGFDGKLPSRGDFVSHGLPRSFLTPWRAWLEEALGQSQRALGDAWLPAWLVAPIWHFAFAGGVAGPDAVLGLMLPSVDRVGRYFPLTVAAVFSGRSTAPDGAACADWLRDAEAAALDALINDGEPDALGAALASLTLPPATIGDAAAACWWTEGNPTLAPTRLTLGALPQAQAFAEMVGGHGSAR